jgi:hypothetical protein
VLLFVGRCAERFAGGSSTAFEYGLGIDVWLFGLLKGFTSAGQALLLSAYRMTGCTYV